MGNSVDTVARPTARLEEPKVNSHARKGVVRSRTKLGSAVGAALFVPALRAFPDLTHTIPTLTGGLLNAGPSDLDTERHSQFICPLVPHGANKHSPRDRTHPANQIHRSSRLHRG
jgi:hypothetical protein